MPRLRPKQINPETANPDDVLTWDGSDWVPSPLPAPPAPPPVPLEVKVVGSATQLATNLTGPKVVGSIIFDPTQYPNVNSFYFEAVLFTQNAIALATVNLYNIDDGEYVTGTLISTSALSAVRVVSSALTVGSSPGNLKDSKKTYEVHLYRDGGSSSDYVTSNLVQLSGEQ